MRRNTRREIERKEISEDHEKAYNILDFNIRMNCKKHRNRDEVQL